MKLSNALSFPEIPAESSQIIRYLDLAGYHFLNHPGKEFYFVLIIDTKKPPWILTRYRYHQNLIKGLTSPGLFKPSVDTSHLLSKGIGWLTWEQLRKILEITKGQLITSAERRFVDDLLIYLGYKIRKGEGFKDMRKQLCLRRSSTLPKTEIQARHPIEASR